MAEQAQNKLRVYPQENVYSFFLFVCPIEDYRAKGRVTAKVSLAWVLFFLSTIIQAVLTYAVYEVIVMGDVEWRMSVLYDGVGCNPGEALCTNINGTLSCAPPSVRLAGKWEELDMDKDGMWTREEAEKMKADVQCKYNVNSVEVFDVFINYLLMREKLIWLHPDVKDGKKVYKPYFDYAAGEIILCGYRSSDMCANLLEMGVFDAPLKYGTAPRVGKTIPSALKYCYDLLEDGGICEQTLPSTYNMWRKSSVEQCYGPDYEKIVYAHPATGRTKSLLAVGYEATEHFEMSTNSWLFISFQACVIAVYLAAMMVEYRDIVSTFTFLVSFPSTRTFNSAPVTEERQEDDDVVKYTIQAITPSHRTVMSLVVISRTIMVVAMGVVGVVFLLKCVEYLDLILNGLGLIFVVEVSSVMFSHMVNHHLKEEMNDATPLEVAMLGSPTLNKNSALKDLVWAAMLLLLTVGSMVYWKVVVSEPLRTALACACLQQGDTCEEAQLYSKEFWGTYWSQTVPSIFEDVSKLKRGLPMDSAEGEKKESDDAAATPAPAPAPASFSQIRTMPTLASKAAADASALLASTDAGARHAKRSHVGLHLG